MTEVAALLPLRIILDLMGIPRSQERFVFDRTNIILGFTDPEYVPEIPTRERRRRRDLRAARRRPGARRRWSRSWPRRASRTPATTSSPRWSPAEIDGDTLSPEELGSFFILLVVAGNETTRNAIAHGLRALTEHPEQQARWMADFDAMAPTAVEEIVRWATPVIHFRRTVTRDGVELGGRRFAEGDKVVLWYNSANRDEAVFADPYRFDVGRHPNDHVGFGGPGPHFCLGAHLARREITVMFRELFRRLPDIHAVGEPDRLRSNFINGIKHLPCRVHPELAGAHKRGETGPEREASPANQGRSRRRNDDSIARMSLGEPPSAD